ncbi:MAG: NADH-quinone oxidoreductase subunit NuoG [Aggregatilineales bacterium]
MSETVTIFIDDVAYQVPKGANLVDAAKNHGNDIPVFCYHPKLAPVGMCRMCLVELGGANIDKDTKKIQLDAQGKPVVRWQPKLQTACTTIVNEGMVVRTSTKQVTDARDEIIEFLLTSHPLDCPICDKGGECPLQNLTMRHGPGASRFVYDDKIHLAKHYPLGDLIYLDRERCIQCARCTRFQEELVGDAVLAFHERGRSLQIITDSDPPFDTYFSGNTTDICPVGALTTADFRFGARPWELTEVPSICPHCPVGCNISASTRPDRDFDGKTMVKRIMPRQNEQVNEIWICDKGRFGHHHSRDVERLTQPLIRQNGKMVTASWDAALTLIAEKMTAAGSNVGAIAGPMLSNEDLFELRHLLDGSGSQKLGLWPGNVSGGDVVAQVGVGVGTNFSHMGKGAAIVVIASNLEEEAPIWYLRTKVASEHGARLIVANARPTESDRWTWGKHHVRYQYGHEIEALDAIKAQIADEKNVVFLVGNEGMDRAGHSALMRSVANLLIETGHYGKANNGLIPIWPGANTQGGFDMGFTSEATEALLNEPPQVLFLADADVIGDDPQHADAIHRAPFKIAVEMFLTPTASSADVVLPRQSVLERDGTYTNGERRVQRFYTAQAPVDDTRPDWKIFAEIGQKLGRGKPKLSAAAIMQDISRAIPRYAAMTYPALAKTEKQFPDVGGRDLYYGGTAYINHGGLGIQWATESESSTTVTAQPVNAPTPVSVPDGSFLVVPVRELYDREPEFNASRHLMKTHIDAPYAVFNAADADRLGLAHGDTVAITLAGHTVEVTARINTAIPVGVVLLPRHLTDQPTPAVPVAGTVKVTQKVEAIAHA